MNETTTTKKSEFVFRRLADSFDQFTGDVFTVFVGNLFSMALLVLLAVVVAARVAYRFSHPPSKAQKTNDATSMGIVWGVLTAVALFTLLHEGVLLLAAAGGQSVPVWRWIVATVAEPLSLVVLTGVAFALVRFFRTPTSLTAAPRDLTALSLALASGLLVGATVVWWLIAFFVRDAEPSKGAGESLATAGAGNVVKWYAFTVGLFALGCVFVVVMYIKDSRTVAWYFAMPLAFLRITVYAILSVVFLLPAMQTWEDTNKQSRVIILLDISPSVTDVSDDGDKTGNKKAKTRMDVLIDFLTDEKVAFLKNLLEKNPVAVYAFGTRLDESPTVIGQGETAWSRAEWESFRKYDFKPFVLRGLSDAGKEQVRSTTAWGDGPGTADWAAGWFARKTDSELKKFAGLESDADTDILRKNLEKLDKRIDVARTITLGTNVPDSITAAINRESANMVQGIVVLSDGRSNLGSESSYTELRERATREKIPVFTVTVGENRERVEITITDVQTPDSAPIDEPWKIIIGVDGANLPNKEVEVVLDLWAPNDGDKSKPKDTKTVEPDHQLTQKLVFAPGDPPHGQTEFILDPATVKEAVRDKLTTMSKDAAIEKRVFRDGKWSVRARVKRDALEPPDEKNPFHESPVREVNVVQQKLRILLMAGAPTREFTFLRTLLVREVADKRATLTTFVQNDAGLGGKLTGEKDELIIPRFPTKFDLKLPVKDDPEAPYNLNEYDVLIAFDPDWSELSLQQAEDLARWIKEGGGGLIYVAGPVNTFQLARVEMNSRLDPLLGVLPVGPADIIAQRIKPIPKNPRRLYLNSKAILGSDLLKLDDKVKDDPVAGWEQFFTDRDKYVKDPDDKVELFPPRGFFSCYPLLTGQQAVEKGLQENGLKPGSAVLAEFADVGDAGETVRLPYLVTNNPSSAWRTCFIASGEFHKMRAFEPGEGTGREYFERVWVKMIKYMAGKRNIKAPRGRVLVGKEAVSGAPLRVQARILNESAKAYDAAAPAPKFTITQELVGREKRSFGPFDLRAKTTPNTVFDGYYAGEVLLDPKVYAAGESLYRVVIDVPDSAEKLTGEFKIRAADPEMDNKKPDHPAMFRMASEFDRDFQARLTDRTRVELATKLPKESGVQRLAFKAGDNGALKLIPECMKTEKRSTQNRGPVNDLWDRGVTFVVTKDRALFFLFMMLSSALALAVGCGIWAALRHVLPTWLSITIAILWVAVNVFGLLSTLLLVLVGLADPALWVVLSGLFALALVVFRAVWPVGVGISLATAAASGAAMVYVAVFEFSGGSAAVSVVLLFVVALLSAEWLARKLMRLA